MNIPDEVIERAAKAQYEWQDGLPSWENDADGFTKAEYVSQTHAAAQVIAEWARREALKEAEQAVRRVPYYKGAFAGVLVIQKILAEGDQS